MVQFKKILSISLLACSASASAAPEVHDSPSKVSYSASFDKTVSGYVNFTTASNGSVKVNVDVMGLPSYGGPFMYHVHELPVPEDGNCTGTKGHLNPYNGNPNATSPADLEVGDLTGRHGYLDPPNSKVEYVDNFISLNPEDPAFVGNLSVVIHYKNTTRLACANITRISNPSANTTSISSGSIGANVSPSNFLMLCILVLGFFRAW